MSVALLGLLVVFGWFTRLQGLIQVLPGASTMKLNTALGLALAGLGLPGFARGSRVTGPIGLLLCVLGIATILEHLAGFDLGIDELLINDWSADDTPGRMGVNTAACLAILGIAYMFRAADARLTAIVAMPAALALISVAVSALVGHAVGLEMSYRWGSSAGMAPHTAIAMGVMGIGLLASGWRDAAHQRGRWLAFGAGSCVAGITLVVWMGVRADLQNQRVLEARRLATTVSQAMVSHVDLLWDALSRLDDREQPVCGQPCRDDITRYMTDFPELIAVGWIAGSDADTGTAVFERAANGIAENADPTTVRALRRTLQRRLTGAATLQTPAVAKLADDDQLVVIRHADGDGDGRSFAAVIGLRDLMRRVQKATGDPAMTLFVDGRQVNARTPAPSTLASRATVMAFILDLPWSVQVPAESGERLHAADWLLAGGLLISAFVASTAFLWQKTRTHLAHIHEINDSLEVRVADRTQQLRQSEQRFRQLADSMPQIVWGATPAGEITYFNLRWQGYTGHDSEQSSTQEWRMAMHPDDAPRFMARWTRCVETGDAFQAEARFRRASDDAYRWQLGRAIPVRNSDGTVVRWFGSLTDIEDFKRVEAEMLALNQILESRVEERTAALAAANVEIAQARTQLQNVLNAATQISIIATDANGIITVFNAGAERMFHYRAQDLVGRASLEILHDPEETVARGRQLSQLLERPVEGFDVLVAMAREDAFSERDWTCIRKDGSRLAVNLVVTAMRRARGEIDGYVGIATDITLRKRLESAVREKNKELLQQTHRAEEANRAKSEFLAAMSHEIRTPMNAILGMADLLWESELSSDQRHYVEVFRRAGDNLMALINDILDLSKIEAGRFELEHTSFDLDEVVGQTIELIAPRARAKGISLYARQHPEVPTALLGDPLRLRQVLVNLLGNAVKFTESGDVTLKIAMGGASSRAEKITLSFAVTDTGIGIEPNQLERIFDDFTQADSSTTRKYGGTGLGLGISRRFVRLMGGELAATSIVGEGSTFAFTATFDLDDAQPSRAVTDLHGHRVLVVDDDSTNRLVLREALTAWGIESHEFDNPGEALADLGRARAANRPYSLVILDMQMPDMNGFEAARLFRDLAPGIPVVILASDTEKGDEQRRIESGVVGFAIKPIKRPELLRVICDAMNVVRIEEQTGSVSAAEQRPLSILVAEDFEDNRVLVQAYMKGTPHRIVFADDGVRAIEYFARERFDLVLMDVQMPKVDGLEATRRIRALERERGLAPTPIIALTANARAADIEASRAAGCNAHLSKPISKRALLAAIDSALPSTVGRDLLQVDVPEGLEELADEYLQARRQELPEFQQLLHRRDFERLRVMGHNLAGSGESYGFAPLSRFGKALEDAARAHDLATIESQVNAIHDYIDRVCLVRPE